MGLPEIPPRCVDGRIFNAAGDKDYEHYLSNQPDSEAFCAAWRESWKRQDRAEWLEGPIRFQFVRQTLRPNPRYRIDRVHFDFFEEAGLIIPTFEYFYCDRKRNFRGWLVKQLHPCRTIRQLDLDVEIALERRVMPYAQYVSNNEHWKLQAQFTKEDADWCCQVCGERRPLDAHHNTYARRGFEARNDLIALCRKCHSLYHEYDRLENRKD